MPRGIAVAFLLLGATFGVAQAQQVSFQDPVNMPAGPSPEALALGNFKGDNVLDLVVANRDANTISVYLGNADGSFQEPVDYPVGVHPWFVATSDLNGDTYLDLVVSNQDSGDLTIYLGLGDGTFVFVNNVPVSAGDGTPFSVAIADFNSDYAPDIVVTDTFNSYLLLGNGDGTFGDPQMVTGPHARFAATGDFNRDGLPDLAISNGHGVDNISILLGDGAGNFTLSDERGVG